MNIFQQLGIRITANDVQADRALKRTRKNFVNLNSTVSASTKLLGTFGVALGATATIALTRRLLDNADAIAKQADFLGISTSALQEYRFAATLAGVSNEQLAKGLQTLAKNASESAQGIGESQRVFKQLDLAVKDTNGNLLPTEKLFSNLADKLAAIENPMERLRVSMKLLGEENGARMINMLKNGGDALDDMRQKARDAGAVMREDVLRNAEEVNDQFSVMSTVLNAQLTSALVALTPVLTGVAQGLADAAKSAGDLVDRFRDISDRTNLQQIQEEMTALLAKREEVEARKSEGGLFYTRARLAADLEYIRELTKQIDALNARRVALRDANRSSDEEEIIVLPSRRDLETAEQFGKRMFNLAREAYPEATKTAEEYGKEQRVIIENFIASQESAEQFGERMFELAREAFPSATQTAQEYGEEMAQIARAHTTAAASSGQTAQIFRDTASGIRGAFRDTFRDVFDNGIQGFDRFGDRMLDLFKNLLAEMAVLAIARPVIVPLAAGLGSALGVPAAAQQSVLGNLGGGAGAAAGGGALASAAPAIGSALGAYLLRESIGGGSSRRGNLSLFNTPAALLDRVTGGGLLGTKFSTRDAGLDLSVGGGGVGVTEFEFQKRKRGLFRGSKSRTLTSAGDPELIAALNDSLQAGAAHILAGAAGLGAASAQSVLASFTATTRLSLAGKSQEEVAAALEAWLDTTIGDMARRILSSTRYGALVKNASRDMIDALFALGAFFESNPLADAAEEMRLASRTIKQAYDEQRISIVALARGFDGSTASAQRLATATAERYQLEKQLFAQISGTRDSVRGLLTSSIQDIRESVMSPSQLADFLSNQAETLAEELKTATDPARVGELVEQINTASTRAYGLIPNEAQGLAAGGFVDFLSGVQVTADDRLRAIQDATQQNHRDLSRIIEDSLSRAAGRLEAAARAQENAANIIVATLGQQTGEYYSYG